VVVSVVVWLTSPPSPPNLAVHHMLHSNARDGPSAGGKCGKRERVVVAKKRKAAASREERPQQEEQQCRKTLPSLSLCVALVLSSTLSSLLLLLLPFLVLYTPLRSLVLSAAPARSRTTLGSARALAVVHAIWCCCVATTRGRHVECHIDPRRWR
jgi:hypothetical protein